MTHSAWWLFCDVAAVYRLAVLITKDKITDRPRELLRRRAYTAAGEPRKGARAAAVRWLFELVICPWCIGLWIAAVVVVLTKLCPGVWQYPAMALTLSGAAGFFAERTDH